MIPIVEIRNWPFAIALHVNDDDRVFAAAALTFRGARRRLHRVLDKAARE